MPALAITSEFGEPARWPCTKLDGVATRISSSRFVGRRAELDRLAEIWKTAVNDELPAAVLVGGEAGVGKSRLVAELTARLLQPALVVTGQCFDLVDRALPFGPIVQMLRALHSQLDDATLRSVIGPALDELAALVPELHGTPRAGIDVAALFEQLRGVFERLAEHVPTLLVLEDLHWADRSTLDLFVFLVRSLRGVPLVLVATYRSDDLHRRHPLRAVLAELDRAGVVERVDLPRFDRDEVRELVTAIIGHEPAVELVDRTYARSDGNAFFAEELLAAGDECVEELSPSLRDILLARIDRLSEDAQHVLRCAAVIGRSADHRLLAATAGLDDDALRAGLREAVTQQVLVTDGDALEYRFRHALVCEVVEDDLLPGDRVALHARVAELLGEHPDWFDGGNAQLSAELACHWNAARDAPRALTAALAAARAAEHMYAYGDALAHLERVLELWSHVPDAEASVGRRHVDVLRDAAVLAEMSGSTDRALDYIRAAAREVDEASDPITAGLVHERWARYLWVLGQPGILEHCHEAVRLVPDTPSEARAKVLATLGQQLMLSRGDGRDAVVACEAAINVAEAVGNRVIEGHARNSLGSALCAMGQTDEGLAQLHRARELALATRSWSDLARAAVNESGALSGLARHEEAVALCLEGAAVARAHGLDRSHGAFLRLNAAQSLRMLGRWDELDEQLREVEAVEPVGLDAWRLREERALLAIGRGQFDQARADTDDLATHLDRSRDSHDPHALERLRVSAAAWSGDEVGALEMALEPMRDPGGDLRLFSDVSIDAALDGLSAGASAARRASDPAERAALVAKVEALGRVLDAWVVDRRWGGAEPGDLDALKAQFAAEVARAQPTDSAAQWRAVAELWSEYGLRPRAAYARWRAAEAAIHEGDRAGAARDAGAAYEATSEIGWTVARDAIVELAHRARLDIGDTGAAVPTAAERYGLTARELDVLALLADGRTNRQIADALFIAVKTASVHVSNILGKLGVANRGEAAAAARRLGLDHVPSGS